MDTFRKDGHLTNTVLEALVRGEALPALTRLEISEHLAYCDLCLQRYTDALAGTQLLIPEHSCQETLWGRIRIRVLHMLTSRYATAAAAVILALSVLWSSKIALPAYAAVPDDNTPSTEIKATETLPERFDSALQSFSRNLHGLFDQISELRQNIEGDFIP